MDPLSDILSLLKPRSYMFGGFDTAGDWSVRFGAHEGIKCYVVASGSAWLTIEDAGITCRLTAGDCFLLLHGRPFVLASDTTLDPVDYRNYVPVRTNGGIAKINGGGDFCVIGGHFTLSGDHADLLLGFLPPVVHLASEDDKAALRWSMERMRDELRDRKPGSFLVAEHHAHLMLLQALRLHMAEGEGRHVGWLFALADRQIGAVLSAMHSDPGRRWTLADLASVAGMSRTAFAQKFRESVGKPPLDYLTRWRMLQAGRRLESSGEPVAVIALSLGYESESAFSTAFRRVMGCSPRQYARKAPGQGAPAIAIAAE